MGVLMMIESDTTMVRPSRSQVSDYYWINAATHSTCTKLLMRVR